MGWLTLRAKHVANGECGRGLAEMRAPGSRAGLAAHGLQLGNVRLGRPRLPACWVGLGGGAGDPGGSFSLLLLGQSPPLPRFPTGA